MKKIVFFITLTLWNSYLPGTGETMITKVVPSGRGLSIAQRDWADSCDYSTLEWLECIIFVSGDERSRRPYL